MICRPGVQEYRIDVDRSVPACTAVISNRGKGKNASPGTTSFSTRKRDCSPTDTSNTDAQGPSCNKRTKEHWKPLILGRRRSVDRRSGGSGSGGRMTAVGASSDDRSRRAILSFERALAG
jgi:hypothetical protein